MTSVVSARIGLRGSSALCCLLAAGCGAGVKTVGFAAGELEVSTVVVDAERDTGWNTSLVLGPHGAPHVAYYDRSNHVLRHAWREQVAGDGDGAPTEGSWRTETVDSDGAVGAHASIAVDDQGALHVSYYDETKGRLKYASNASGSWVTEVVDDGSDAAAGQPPHDVGRDSAIAVDTTGAAHIAYFDLSKGTLRYARGTHGAWQMTTVDESGRVGRFASIAVDRDARPHVGYYDLAHGDLRYATLVRQRGRTEPRWKVTVVDRAGDVGQHTSTAVDIEGRVHMSYFDHTRGVVKHALKNPGSPWVLEDVARSRGGAAFTDISMDAEGRLHVAYYDGKSGALGYAIGRSSDGAPVDGYRWRAGAVDRVGRTGTDASLATDPEGNVSISYRDAGQGDLRLATVRLRSR
jgi:hypothetical protein